MPFKSKSQMRRMFATDPKLAKKFASETVNIKGLPEKKKKMPVVPRPTKKY